MPRMYILQEETATDWMETILHPIQHRTRFEVHRLQKRVEAMTWGKPRRTIFINLDKLHPWVIVVALILILAILQDK